MNTNKLAQKITAGSILKFTYPTIIMMVFMSLYTIVDGVFVSRLINTDALSAVNIVFPLQSMINAVGIMLGTGGSAIIAKKLGEGKTREANGNFTFIVLCAMVIGIALSGISLLFTDEIIRALGADAVIFDYCRNYIRPLMYFFPVSILQLLFQSLFVTAGKPKIGLAVTVIGGVANIVLDYIFIKYLNMGIGGAAVATGIGYCALALFGMVYFFVSRKGGGDGFTASQLYFVKPTFDKQVLLLSCTNGSSEMVTNLSSAVITFLFNIIMMRMLGSDGVAAITIILYAEFMLVSVNLGYSSGIAPMISYNFGSRDTHKLKRIFRLSTYFIFGFSLFIFCFSIAFAKPIVSVFAPQGTEVYTLAVRGFYLYSFCYLFKGFNIFASSMFTAFSDGKVSALLSFMRSLVFIVVNILGLTQLLGVDGVWLAVPAAELMAMLMSLYYIWKMRPVYQYA